jgi:hypothetical protein
MSGEIGDEDEQDGDEQHEGEQHEDEQVEHSLAGELVDALADELRILFADPF